MTMLFAAAQPEVIQSLPPITIRHVMEGPNPWTAFWGPLVVAVAGLIVGVITLTQVLRQIRLATKQLRIAAKELVAVKADFKLAQRQFDLSQQQFNAVMKSPDVVVTTSVGAESAQVIGGPGGATYRATFIQVEIHNKGSKVAKDLIVDVFVPTEAHFVHARLAQGGFQRFDIEGEAYERWRAFGPQRLHAHTRTTVSGRFMFKPELKSMKVFWHADDDEFSYPAEGYGRQTLDFKLQM
jgi:hypothetical protein